MATSYNIPIGARFGRLTVVGLAERVGGRTRIPCRCDCGNEAMPLRFHVTSGATRSCGCLMVQNRTRGTKWRHGHAHTKTRGGTTPTYTSWQGMIARCHSPNEPAYKWYGALGVTVCDRWRHSFGNFLADMGERPRGYTLDRVNPFLGYEPNNCRWATVTEQNRNKRTSPRWIAWRQQYELAFPSAQSSTPSPTTPTK